MQTVEVRTAFFDLGSPWQNVVSESINAQIRCEDLYGETEDTLVEAKYLADDWSDTCSQERPHGSLNWTRRSRFWDEWVSENHLAIA